jgi:hypothetical protein
MGVRKNVRGWFKRSTSDCVEETCVEHNPFAHTYTHAEKTDKNQKKKTKKKHAPEQTSANETTEHLPRSELRGIKWVSDPGSTCRYRQCGSK